MTWYDRIFFAALFVGVLVVGFRRGAAPVDGGAGSAVQVSTVTVTNTVSVVAAAGSVASRAVSVNRVTVEYQPFTFGQAGDDVWAYCRGRKFKPRFRVEEGIVIEVCKEYVRIVGDDGREHFIYPLEYEGDFLTSGNDPAAAPELSTVKRSRFER